MTEDSIPPLLLQTIITIPIFWYTKKGGPKGKLVMNEEYTRKETAHGVQSRKLCARLRFFATSKGPTCKKYGWWLEG